MDLEDIETDKYLPSGHWEGFYCYNNSPIQHKMRTNLTFQNNKVTGTGIDDIDPFKWIGKYDLDTFKITKTKIYATHEIAYSGDIDENGIWGIWNNAEDLSKLTPEILEIIQSIFKDKLKGGFHIWPVKKLKNMKWLIEKRWKHHQYLKKYTSSIFYKSILVISSPVLELLPHNYHNKKVFKKNNILFHEVFLHAITFVI